MPQISPSSVHPLDPAERKLPLLLKLVLLPFLPLSLALSVCRVVLFVQVADAGDADALTAAAAAGDAAALVELCRCDDAFATALKTTIRERGSPRHVPAIVCRVPDVPRTNNGKKVEMACMNLLRGRPVANRGSIANAGVVDFYEALAPHLEKLLPQEGGR